MRWNEILNELDYYDDKADREHWRELSPHWVNQSEIQRRPTFRDWPPTAQQIQQVEREVLQDPEWLAYYARFDWRSFQRVGESNYRFDKNTMCFRFENVPAIWYTPKNIKGHPEGGLASPDRKTVYMDLNGKLAKNPYRNGKEKYGHLVVILPAALYQIRNFAIEQGKKVKSMLGLLTGEYYIRFGRWYENEQSKNYRTGEMEDGVSVYHAHFDIDEERWEIDPTVDEAAINGTLQSLIYERDKRIFVVQGRELEQTGSDGEPLLKDVKAVKQLAYGDVFVSGMFDPREDDWD